MLLLKESRLSRQPCYRLRMICPQLMFWAQACFAKKRLKMLVRLRVSASLAFRSGPPARSRRTTHEPANLGFACLTSPVLRVPIKRFLAVASVQCLDHLALRYEKLDNRAPVTRSVFYVARRWPRYWSADVKAPNNERHHATEDSRSLPAYPAGDSNNLGCPVLHGGIYHGRGALRIFRAFPA